MSHSAQKCYETKDRTVERLSNKCRTNGSHPEPFLSGDFTDSEECPGIGKCTSQITKYTSERDARHES